MQSIPVLALGCRCKTSGLEWRFKKILLFSLFYVKLTVDSGFFPFPLSCGVSDVRVWGGVTFEHPALVPLLCHSILEIRRAGPFLDATEIRKGGRGVRAPGRCGPKRNFCELCW